MSIKAINKMEEKPFPTIKEIGSEEIKFRAWDKLKKEMVQIVQMHFLTSKGAYVTPDTTNTVFKTETERRTSTFELMQYTLVRDCNGKEIYKGDIVIAIAPPEHSKESVTAEVIQNKMSLAWAVRGARELGHDDHYMLGLDLFFFDSLEVIGNIYENPELLK